MLLDLLGALLSPERCAACDEQVPLQHAFCTCCAVSILPADFPVILDATTVEIGAFGGALAQAIYRLKYNRQPHIARPLGDLMAQAAQQLTEKIDEVVPVPLATSRLRERGYNQAALLAARIARYLHVPHKPMRLRRVIETGQLAHQAQDVRKQSVQGAFLCNHNMEGRSVLLVDDVLTTGATLGSCMEALYKSGAANVMLCVAARVERHSE